ncbi:MAG: hypothetical protein AAF913_09125 [Pseudomonadota bacterium]
MTLPTLPEPQPLRKSAQRLRWFVGAFEAQVAQTEDETGNRFAIDRGALAEVFASWLKAFEAQKPTDDADNPAYVGFAAGLMLRSLIKFKPARISDGPPDADQTNPAYFWPEGYLYVAFCLNVRGLVLAQDFNTDQQPSTALDEARTWWSFKENVGDDPSLAIAFLDLFAGDDPNWSAPDLFRSGQVRQIANRFYTEIALD